jgi:hypothetical protein
VRGKFNWWDLPSAFWTNKKAFAFSYSHSHLDRVIKYIDKQEEHHRRETFREEYLGLLEKFQVEYDQRFVFEWIEEG